MIRNIFLGVLMAFFTLSCNTKQSNNIRIAAASNMQFALEQIVKQFEAQYPYKCDIILGSSGQLTTQIIQGAPYDLFLSADKNYAYNLFRKNKAEKPPQIYAQGQLILWSNKTEIKPSLSNLNNTEVPKIGVANPAIAPYGKASIDFLKQTGFYEDIKQKLVFGESINQVNQFQMSGATTFALTSSAIAHSGKLNKHDQWIGLDGYSPINQYAVQLKSNTNKDEASTAFWIFLFGDEAKKILKDYGYSVNF